MCDPFHNRLALTCSVIKDGTKFFPIWIASSSLTQTSFVPTTLLLRSLPFNAALIIAFTHGCLIYSSCKALLFSPTSSRRSILSFDDDAFQSSSWASALPSSTL